MHAPDEKLLSPISGAPARFVFAADVLGRHEARYYQDTVTGYIFVDRPHWLAEAYGAAIAVTDTGILSRNLRNIDFCARFLGLLGARSRGFKGVDLGAGYGVFVRGMRDRGIRFYWNDPYAENLMARGYEAEGSDFDTAVAFEVLEHTENPLEFLRAQKAHFGFRRLVFSATCFRSDKVPDRDWWYWAFESGQHISFFTRAALDHIAAELGMRVVPLGGDLYAMEDRGAGRSALALQLASLVAQSHLPLLSHRGALTSADHYDQRDSLRAVKTDQPSDTR